MKIVRDTREQQGWSFAFYQCDIIHKKLDYGDYSLEGLENSVGIERKASTGELYLNLGQKKNKERFYRELEVLSTFDLRQIVCEFPETYLYDFPNNSNIPKHRWKYLKMTGAYLRKLVYETSEKFGIEIVFHDSPQLAQQYVYYLLSGYKDRKCRND